MLRSVTLPFSLRDADPRFRLPQVNGKWETEIVREPTIIGAYVRQRQLIEEEKTEADDLLPSDDEGKNERHKKRCVPFLASHSFRRRGARSLTLALSVL